jgi:hypothetical protein
MACLQAAKTCVRLRTDQNAPASDAAGMHWPVAIYEWKYLKLKVGARWDRLTKIQLDAIAGNRALLGEQICATYGIAPAQAERQICGFEAENDRSPVRFPAPP